METKKKRTFSQASHLDLAEVQGGSNSNREGALGNGVPPVGDIHPQGALEQEQK